MCEMKPGELVGVRGPYGRGYWDVVEHRPGEGVAILGGGCGMAVLALLAERLPRATVAQGAKTADALFFRDRFPDQVLFTDDGSAGRQGFPTEWLRERVEAGEVTTVYSCGPEQMMVRVAEVCRGAGIGCQVSLERYMKCGIGVCGQCDCDGRRVCVEGPTFCLEELGEMPSFGQRKRDKTGRAVPIGPGDVCPSGPAVV
jgi:dihydroorotate dehydrogenase electron transfer subunit